MGLEARLIAAVDEERGFGRAGSIPWNHPADMAHFRAMTMGAAVVIGRITWESIRRPLPGRLLLVVASADPGLPPGAIRVGSWSEAKAVASAEGRTEIWAAGGVGIYRAAIEDGLDAAHVTRVPGHHDCDVFLPPLTGLRLVRTVIRGELEFDNYVRA